MKHILINNWHCSIGEGYFEGIRTATNLNSSEKNATVIFNPHTFELSFDLENKIPSEVLRWLIKPELSDAWDVGAEAALHLGTDDVFDRNPYKE